MRLRFVLVRFAALFRKPALETVLEYDFSVCIQSSMCLLQALDSNVEFRK